MKMYPIIDVRPPLDFSEWDVGPGAPRSMTPRSISMGLQAVKTSRREYKSRGIVAEDELRPAAGFPSSITLGVVPSAAHSACAAEGDGGELAHVLGALDV
jgi:hypothetical protein